MNIYKTTIIIIYTFSPVIYETSLRLGDENKHSVTLVYVWWSSFKKVPKSFYAHIHTHTLRLQLLWFLVFMFWESKKLMLFCYTAISFHYNIYVLHTDTVNHFLKNNTLNITSFRCCAQNYFIKVKWLQKCTSIKILLFNLF